MNNHPPKLPLRFFHWFCDPEIVEDVEGDLLERFDKRPSRWRFALEVLKLFRPGVIRKPVGAERLNTYSIIKHYLKIGSRNLLKQKSLACLNIGGLVMGLTITLIITLWVIDEFSFDRQNDQHDRVVRIMLQQTINENVRTSFAVPFPLSIELEKQCGDDFKYLVPSTWFGDYTLSIDKNVINAYGGFMGKGAAELMSLNMQLGNWKSLAEDGGVLLSESVANSLFGDKNPVGQVIKVHNNWSMKVTGVFEDIPSNSSFHRMSFIGNWDFYLRSVRWINKMEWDDNSFQLFALLTKSSDINTIGDKIAKVVHLNIPADKKHYNTNIFLHPMTDWHLKSNWKNGVKAGGNIQYHYQPSKIHKRQKEPTQSHFEPIYRSLQKATPLFLEHLGL